MEENKKMEDQYKEEAEVKTVYIKEKKRTGWWKIVMLVLAILIAIIFAVNAVLTGFGAWQLKRIADQQENFPMQAQEEILPDNNEGSSGLSDINLEDILQFFGYGNQNGSSNGGNYTVPDQNDDSSYFNIPDQNGGSDIFGEYGLNGEDGNNSGGSFMDWLEGLFGTGDGNGTGQESSQGF